MNRRLKLHEKLCDILGSRNVYFQPPESIKMKYPAIVYSSNDIKNVFANDNVYLQNKQYQITVIDKNPESKITEEIIKLPTASYARHFTSDNLHHDVITLYF